MRPPITIQLDRDDARYVPGEPVTGRVSWRFDHSPERVVVRLRWHTSGKGSRDTGVAEALTWEPVSSRDERAFSFAGLDGPYSFSGRLISVNWLVEAVAEGVGGQAELGFTLSPTGEEVRP
ncbi:MAG: hypothetical protein ACE37H_13655 [Phycisphaeraceae bacterium]